MTPTKTVLSIAGSDPSGGAGIQADIKTISSLGCYALSIFTALTAQNTQGVDGIYPIPPDFIRAQFQSIHRDIRIDAIKIGMLHDTSVIQTVAECLDWVPHIPVVLDPVMVASSGDRLLSPNALSSLKNILIPKASLITPNLEEACLLGNVDGFSDAVLKTPSFQKTKALIKDIKPDEEKAIDLFYDPITDNRITYTHLRIISNNTHGTGCTLSSAISAYLAQGLEFTMAIKKAKTYIRSAIKESRDMPIGKGIGPLNHFFGVPTDDFS